MQDMLDRLPPDLHQEVVHQRRLRRSSTAGTRRRTATPAPMALPRLQLPKGRAAQGPFVLVREGDGSKITPWSATLLLRSDMCPAAASTQEVPASLPCHLSRRALLSVFSDGTYPALLLRSKLPYPPLSRHRLRKWLELRRHMRTSHALWRAHLSPTVS